MNSEMEWRRFKSLWHYCLDDQQGQKFKSYTFCGRRNNIPFDRKEYLDNKSKMKVCSSCFWQFESYKEILEKRK